MKTYFPNIYDLKYIIKDIPGLKDVGLAKLSYEIGVTVSLFSVIELDLNIRQVLIAYWPSLAISRCWKRVSYLDQSNFHHVWTLSLELDLGLLKQIMEVSAIHEIIRTITTTFQERSTTTVTTTSSMSTMIAEISSTTTASTSTWIKCIPTCKCPLNTTTLYINFCIKPSHSTITTICINKTTLNRKDIEWWFVIFVLDYLFKISYSIIIIIAMQ